MKYRGFCGPSYQSQAITADGERLVNWMVERMESPGATARFALYPTPGMSFVSYTDTGPGRAHEFYDNREFIVDGALFYEIDETGTPTARGTLAVDSNPATISWNGDGGGELFITSGGNGYVMNLTTNVVSTISALTGKATMGRMLHGYFLALDANTGTIYSSELQDGLTWNTSTMFQQRSAQPDPWWSMEVKGDYIYLFGPETGEVWYDAGSSPFPFAKHPSGGIEFGTAAPWSVKVTDTSIMWLGGSRAGKGSVKRATGFAPEDVATYPVQYAISNLTDVSDAYADSYTESGHTYYVLSFLKGNRTWVYDLQMQMWHERGTWDVSSAISDFSVWRPHCHAFAFGRHRWLDVVDAAVYEASLTTGTDAIVNSTSGGLIVDDLPIRRLRRGPTVSNENSRTYYSAFEVDLEAGLGLTSGQGSNPQVQMRLSNDGGRTWSAERMRSAGKTGEFSKRVRWERCGMGRRRAFEISVTDPIPWRITDAYLDGVQATRGAA